MASQETTFGHGQQPKERKGGFHFPKLFGRSSDQNRNTLIPVSAAATSSGAIIDSVSQPIDTRSGKGMSRRAFIVGGVTATATTAAAIGVVKHEAITNFLGITSPDKGNPSDRNVIPPPVGPNPEDIDPTSTPEAKPTKTPIVVEPTKTATHAPEPTNTPRPTQEATSTPEPTSTPKAPENTATPTETPSPTPEAIRYNGSLPIEIVSTTPERLGFDYMIPNPEYPEGDVVAHRLALRVLAQLRYAMETEYQDFDLNTANNPDIDAFEQEMLNGNIEFQVPGHPLEEMDISSPIRMVTIRPEQGLRLEVAVDKNQINNSRNTHDGNLEITEGAQFRFGVDENLGATLRLIYEPTSDDKIYIYREFYNPMYILADLRGGLELFRFRNKMTNQTKDILNDGQEDPQIMGMMLTDSGGRPADEKYIYDWPGRAPVIPLKIFNR